MTTLPLSVSPPARLYHSLTSDTARQELVMFGGVTPVSSSLNVSVNDTWVFTGSSWTLRTPAVSPSPRYGHAAAFDQARGELVVFGGDLAASSASSGCPTPAMVNNETWVWNGVNWSLASISGPPARSNHVMAYDVARARVVMTGGVNNAGVNFGDIWEWDGSSWTNVIPGGAVPSPVRYSGMTYDEANGRCVLFGGAKMDGTCLGETWSWNGTSWSLISSSGPAPRFGHTMAYDRNRRVVIVYAGIVNLPAFGPINSLWELSGSSWIQRTPTSPAALSRGHSRMEHFTPLGKMVTFGGTGQDCLTSVYGDTTTYTVDGTLTMVSPAIGTLDVSILSGIPNGVRYIAVALASPSFPNGWFFGIDISLNDIFIQVGSGCPFFGGLDASGNDCFRILLPSGLTLYAVALAFPTATSPLISAVTNPASVTIL